MTQENEFKYKQNKIKSFEKTNEMIQQNKIELKWTTYRSELVSITNMIN